MILRRTSNKPVRLILRIAASALCLAAAIPATGQQAAAVGVQFAFKTNTINARFSRVSKSTVESAVAQALAQVCSAQLRPWRCSPSPGAPGFQFEVFEDKGEYFVRMTLAHAPGRPDLTDSWKERLYSLEDLSAGVLPMNDSWVSPIRVLVQNMLKGSSDMGRSVLASLSEVVPLGTDVAMIPSDQSPRPSAVLPLAWNDYKEFAMWRYRLIYQGDAGEITLHAGGAGRNAPFKPGAEVFQGILVVHETYQLGSLGAEPIGAHLQDLGGLVPVAFYVEGFMSPGDMSIAH